MPNIDHAALEAAARKFDAAGQLNMFVGTSVILALLEERKRLVEALRILVLDARPTNWNDGDDENAEYAWRRADAALAGEKEPTNEA
jgi:hypothetical protein